MKNILSVATLFVVSFALVSLGGRAGAEPEVSAKTHSEIGQGVASIMTDMMMSMSKITNEASAKTFAGALPDMKEKMKAYLKAAQALPAPTDAEKAEVNKIMDDAQEKAGPVLMQMMMGLAQNPEAEAIGKVLEGVMADEEMEKVGSDLEGLYKTEKEAEKAPVPAIE